MAENTKIEWCDYTFNPWIGCSKVSAGCANCYAERDFDKRWHVAQWGPNGTRVVTSEGNWKMPLKWNRFAIDPVASAMRSDFPRRPRVFCASLADVFEDWDGPVIVKAGGPVYLGKDFRASRNSEDRLTLDHVRQRLFQLIDATPYLDWLLLTKRPENIRRMWLPPQREMFQSPDGRWDLIPGLARKNVWLGTSVENQEQAEKRIPELLECRDLSPVLFLSCEPLLGPVELWPVAFKDCPNAQDLMMCPETGAYECCSKCDYTGFSFDEMKIDWVIAGGESGPGARPMHPDWVRSICDECVSAGVPFLFKQWGEWLPSGDVRVCDLPARTGDDDPRYYMMPDRVQMLRVGKTTAGRLLDGVEWNQFPEVNQ